MVLLTTTHAQATASEPESSGASEAPKEETATTFTVSKEEKEFLDRARPLTPLFERLSSEGVADMDGLTEYLAKQNNAQLAQNVNHQIEELASSRKSEEDDLAKKFYDSVNKGATREEAQADFDKAFNALDRNYTKKELTLLKQVVKQVEQKPDPAKTVAGRIKQLTAPTAYPDADPESLKTYAKANPDGDLEKEAQRLQKRHEAAISVYGGKKAKQEEQGKPATADGSSSNQSSRKWGPEIPSFERDPKAAVKAADEVLANWHNRNKSK